MVHNIDYIYVTGLNIMFLFWLSFLEGGQQGLVDFLRWFSSIDLVVKTFILVEIN